jgi:hypothetical protein
MTLIHHWSGTVISFGLSGIAAILSYLNTRGLRILTLVHACLYQTGCTAVRRMQGTDMIFYLFYRQEAGSAAGSRVMISSSERTGWFFIMFAIPAPQINIAYGFSIGLAIVCIINGLVNWNKGRASGYGRQHDDLVAVTLMDHAVVPAITQAGTLPTGGTGDDRSGDCRGSFRQCGPPARRSFPAGGRTRGMREGSLLLHSQERACSGGGSG